MQPAESDSDGDILWPLQWKMLGLLGRSQWCVRQTQVPLSRVPAGLSGATAEFLPGHRKAQAQSSGSPAQTQDSLHFLSKVLENSSSCVGRGCVCLPSQPKLG